MNKLAIDNARLDAIKKEADEGLFTAARLDLDSCIGSDAFDLTDPVIRARFLRTRAYLALRDNDFVTADVLSSRAKELDDSEDQRILESNIVFLRDGPAKALEKLPVGGTKTTILRSKLLYFLGKPQEGLSLLQKVTATDDESAEFHRVFASLALSSHQYATATLHANQAFSIAPRNFQVRFTCGIVYYYACVPEDLIPRSPDSVPEPFPTFLLTLDKTARLFLRRADQLFSDCLLTLDSNDVLVAPLQLWRLACLSTDPDRKNEATDLARTLLYDKRLDGAVQWIVRYNLDVDLSDWISKSSKAAAEGNSTPEVRRALAWVWIERGDLPKAQALLEVADKDESDADRLSRKLLLSRSYAVGDDFANALAVLENDNDPQLDPVRKMLSDELLASQEARSDRYSNDALGLLARVTKAAADRDWSFVVSHTDELLSRLKTPPAVRVSLLGLYNTKRFADFLKLYDENASWSGLSADSSLRRAHISALWNLNRRSDAVLEAKQLFDEEPTAANGDIYGRLLFESGDLESIAVISRRLRDAADLTPEIALRFATWLQDSSPQDAGILWDRAMDKGVGEELATAALSIADKVGRGQKTEPLIRTIQELAERGTGEVTVQTLEQVLDLNAQIAKANQLASGQYRFGTIPIHIVADMTRMPIFVSHWLEPTLNMRRTPGRWTSVYVRHGSRGSLSRASFSESRILIDTTAVFICDLLGVLPLVTSRFKKVIIPDSIFGLLAEMKDRILPGQPRRIEHIRNIVETIEKHGIRRIPTQNGFTWAQANDGYFVTNLPPIDPKTGNRLELTDIMTQKGLNLTRLISDLATNGTINQWQADKAIQVAGTEGKEPMMGPSIPSGATLLASAVILEYLAEADLLGPILGDGYKLFITEDDSRFLRTRVEEADQRVRFAQDLDRVRQTVRDGVGSGMFELASGALQQPTVLESNARSIAILLETAQTGDLLLVDDRFCNASIHNGKGATVVSTFDVLSSLNAANVLGDEDFFRILLDARRSALFFIPLTSRELRYHLQEARISDGRVAETRSLRDIRRYIGACLSTQAGLRIVAPDDERPFLSSLDDALAEVLRIVEASEARDAFKEYVVMNLHAAEISALRRDIDSNELAAFKSLDSLVHKLET